MPMDRVIRVSGPQGRGFDSLQAHHLGEFPNDPPALDSNLRNQFLEDCLAERYGPVVDRTKDPGPERVQLRLSAPRPRWLRPAPNCGSQCPEPLGQGLDMEPAEILVHLARLEGVEIAVEGFFRSPDPGTA